jgi:hypothetical protein
MYGTDATRINRLLLLPHGNCPAPARQLRRIKQNSADRRVHFCSAVRAGLIQRRNRASSSTRMAICQFSLLSESVAQATTFPIHYNFLKMLQNLTELTLKLNPIFSSSY